MRLPKTLSPQRRVVRKLRASVLRSRAVNLKGDAVLILVIILLLLSIGGGAWGHPRWGYAGWSPLGIILVVILLLWLTGNLHMSGGNMMGGGRY